MNLKDYKNNFNLIVRSIFLRRIPQMTNSEFSGARDNWIRFSISPQLIRIILSK